MEEKIHQLVYSSIAETKMSLQEAQGIRDRAEVFTGLKTCI